jgi:hypothetical protein
MKVFPGLIYLRIKIKTSQNVLVLICHFSSLCAFSSRLLFLPCWCVSCTAAAAAGVPNLNCKWISSGFIDFCRRTSFPGQHSYYPFVPIWNGGGTLGRRLGMDPFRTGNTTQDESKKSNEKHISDQIEI